MGRLDYENELSDAQAITVTAASTNVVDLNEYPQYIAGEDLYMNVTVNTAFAGGTSVQAVLRTDSVAAMSSPVAVVTPAVVLTAAAVAGATLLCVNLKGLTLERYIDISNVVDGTMSAGAVDARLEITPVRGTVDLT